MRIIILLIVFPVVIFSQKEIICKADTLDLFLAYESGGQFFYGEKRLKKPELVRFTDNKITVEDYQRGVFILPEKNSTEFNDLKTCGFFLGADSMLKYSAYSFDTLRTKVFTKTNKTFFGGKKSENISTVFKYKVMKMKITAVYSGLMSRQLVNMDRKTKKDPATVTLRCPVYIISRILQIESVN